MWILDPDEIEFTVKLDGAKRYAYFIKKITAHPTIWSLWQESGWALVEDEKGREMVPVWPHRDYAQLCAVDEWKGCQPKPIPLDVWLNEWISGMIRDNRRVDVFPTPQDKGFRVEPAQLESDIRTGSDPS